MVGTDSYGRGPLRMLAMHQGGSKKTSSSSPPQSAGNRASKPSFFKRTTQLLQPSRREASEKEEASSSSAAAYAVIPEVNVSATVQAYAFYDNNELGEMPHAAFKSGFVSIVGNPNVGKSTLLNALLGQKLCIVSPKPQTTRHRIFGVLTEKDCQIVFSDTPGMLKPAYTLQETMQDAIHGAVNDGDVTMLVTDVFSEPLFDQQVITRLNATSQPVVVVVNKIDLLQSSPNATNSRAALRVRRNNVSLEEIDLFWKSQLPRADLLHISAANKDGLAALKQFLLDRLSPGPKYYPEDVITDRNERFFAAEIIREALFNLFKEEIPYSSEVIIDQFEDRPSGGLSAIDARIIVNRRTQKAIIIGTKGSKLKELGTQARLELEKFLDRKVYLNLHVVVDEDWRNRKDAMRRYGYVEDD
eukprot:gene11466-12825_t